MPYYEIVAYVEYPLNMENAVYRKPSFYVLVEYEPTEKIYLFPNGYIDVGAGDSLKRVCTYSAVLPNGENSFPLRYKQWTTIADNDDKLLLFHSSEKSARAAMDQVCFPWSTSGQNCLDLR